MTSEPNQDERLKMEASQKSAQMEAERLVAVFGTEDVAFAAQMDFDGKVGMVMAGNRLTMIEAGFMCVKQAAEDMDMPMAKLVKKILAEDFRVYL